MSLKSRYTFIKKYYPNHFFVFLTNKGYMFYGVDKRIIENFCKSKNIINWLQKKKINYLIIDNTTIIDSFECDDSQYEKYYYQSLLCDILSKRVWEDSPPKKFYLV